MLRLRIRWTALAIGVAMAMTLVPNLRPASTVLGSVGSATPRNSRAPAGRSGHTLRVPFLTRDAVSFARLKAAANAGATRRAAVAAVPTRTYLPPSPPPPTIHFPTFGYLDELSFTRSYPPDGALAVGPSSLLVSANSDVALYDRQGHNLFGLQGMGGFFRKNNNETFFDPRALYDAGNAASGGFNGGHGRFVVVAATRNNSAQIGTIRLAISRNESPTLPATTTTSWCSYSINDVISTTNHSANTWGDYPTLGMDGNNLYITTSQYTFTTTGIIGDRGGTFQYSRLFVIPKASVYPSATSSSACGTLTFTDFNALNGHPLLDPDGTDAVAVQPATQPDALPGQSGPMYFVDAIAGGGAQLAVRTVSITPTLHLNAPTWVTVSSYSTPASVPEPGGVATLDSGDTRLTSAVERYGVIYAANSTGSVAPSLSTTSNPYANTQWYRFNAGALAAQTHAVADPNVAYFDPGVMVACAVTPTVGAGGAPTCTTPYVGLQVSAAGPNRFGSAAVLLANGTPAIYQAGNAVINDGSKGASRWGDYPGVSVDPNNPRAMWVMGEYAYRAGLAWGTAVARLVPTSPWAWGDNTYGELGTTTGNCSTPSGTAPCSTTPVQVSGLVTPAVSVAAGFDFSLALLSDGTVAAWGDGPDGQLGDGRATTSMTPVQVSNVSNAVAIAAGYWHGLALSAAGTLWAWGDNQYGEAGNGTSNFGGIPTPVRVSIPATETVVATAAGWYHSLALMADGTVWAWGDDNYGQLGIAPTCHPIGGCTGQRTRPVPVPGLSNVVAIAAGAYHNLALKADGTLWAWGDNFYGQLGDGALNETFCSCVPTPAQVSGFTYPVVATAGGANHSLAITLNGAAWAWGLDSDGQLGTTVAATGTAPCYYYYCLPVPVSGFTTTAGLAGGEYHSLALRADGTAFGTGYDSYGQLGGMASQICGYPAFPCSMTPVTVTGPGGAGGLSGAVAVAAGNIHSVAAVPLGPVLTVMPGSGPPRTAVMLAGAGYNANETVTIAWTCPGVPCATARLLGTATTDANGSFSGLNLTVPATATAGAYVISGTGTSQLTGSTAFVIAPALSSTPISGPPTTTVTLTGTGYAAGEPVTLAWDCAAGACGGSAALTTTVASASGQFSGITVTVPGTATAGLHAISGIGGVSGAIASTPFTVTPALTATPASGPPTSTVTLTGVGFGAGEPITLTWSCTSGTGTCPTARVLTTTATNANGQFTGITVTVPGTATAGLYSIGGAGGISNAGASTPFTVTPALTATPDSGPPTSTVILTGVGFGAGEPITLTWDCAGGGCPKTAVLATTMTDAYGQFSGITVTVPATATAGPHSINGIGGSSNAGASTPFTVTPFLSGTPNSGPPTTTVTLSGNGFGAGEQVALTWDCLDSACVGNATLATAMADANGQFSGITVTVPATATAGLHIISGIGGTSDTIASIPFTVTPALYLTPTSGIPGSPATLSGSGFDANEPVMLTWDCAMAGCPSTAVLAATMIDANGQFSGVTVTVPSTATFGMHIVAGIGGTSSLIATAAYTITPSLSIAPTSGTANSTARVSGTGYGANDTVTLTWDCTASPCGSSSVLGTVTADANGQFANDSVTIPPLALPGLHSVGGSGSSGAVASTPYTVTASGPTPTPTATPTSTPTVTATPTT